MPYASNNGIKIHFELEGSGPPLVLQHGLTGNLGRWYDSGYVKGLKDDYRLVLVDARGHGKSDKPHDPAFYRPYSFAGDIVAVLDALKIEKSNYFGYSMGGAIGFMGLARHALNRFNSLILGGFSPYMTESMCREQFVPRIAAMQMAADQGMAAYAAYLEKRDGALAPAYKAQVLANDGKALLAAVKGMSEWPGAEDILPKINVPCLIFAGEADGFYTGAKEGAAHMPNSRFISFPGLNHIQCQERSDLTLPHIKKFLAEVNKDYRLNPCDRK